MANSKRSELRSKEISLRTAPQKNYCWCGKLITDADVEAGVGYVLFNTTRQVGVEEYEAIGYGFCREHKEQWRIKHPFVFIDGIGVNALERLDRVAQQAHNSGKGIDYISYFPCVFTGDGSYSQRQAETTQRMFTEYIPFIESHRHHPLIVVNNPFTQILGNPDLIGHPNRLRLALKHLYRPAVWIVITDSALTGYTMYDTVRLANKTQPLTYVLFTDSFSPNMRGAWSYWNTAVRLLFQQHKFMGKEKKK